MKRFNLLRPIVLAFALAGVNPLFAVESARADAYLGAMIGMGVPMGTGISVNNGTAYGATLGANVLPLLSIAATYLHDGLETSTGGFDYKIDQYLAELNFFSLLFMNAGFHAGSVKTDVVGISSTDLGYGFHLGFDFKLTQNVSVGAAGYWTYVTADDKYSVLNLMVPLKVWF